MLMIEGQRWMLWQRHCHSVMSAVTISMLLQMDGIINFALLSHQPGIMLLFATGWLDKRMLPFFLSLIHHLERILKLWKGC